MKNLLVVTLALGLFLPSAALAMSHEDKPMEHQMDMQHKMDTGSSMHEKMMEKGGMDMHGDMMMLGEETVDGVKAMAHLKDVHEAMSKMNMTQTHHFMVMFMDTAGKPVDEGLVAVKITDPAGQTGDPIKLMGMQGHFGADVALSQPGKYVFEVGTKLQDEQKRQFEFQYEVK